MQTAIPLKRVEWPKDSGGYIGGVPPVPFPNTEVKPTRADGTARETVWESRSLPDFCPCCPSFGQQGLFLSSLRLPNSTTATEDSHSSCEPTHSAARYP